MKEAEEYVRKCDLLLVVGTSAQVQPASNLPVVARKNGAKILEINISETALTKEVTDMFILGEAGTVLPGIISAL